MTLCSWPLAAAARCAVTAEPRKAPFDTVTSSARGKSTTSAASSRSEYQTVSLWKRNVSGGISAVCVSGRDAVSVRLGVCNGESVGVPRVALAVPSSLADRDGVPKVTVAEIDCDEVETMEAVGVMGSVRVTVRRDGEFVMVTVVVSVARLRVEETVGVTGGVMVTVMVAVIIDGDRDADRDVVRETVGDPKVEVRVARDTVSERVAVTVGL